MKLYYYHTRPIISALEEWKDSKHPGHILYGLTHFEKLGIQTILYPYKKLKYRWQLMIYVLYTVLLEKEPYDVLYGTSYRGLELLIFFGHWVYIRNLLLYGIINQSQYRKAL